MGITNGSFMCGIFVYILHKFNSWLCTSCPMCDIKQVPFIASSAWWTTTSSKTACPTVDDPPPPLLILTNAKLTDVTLQNIQV